jgi:CrcB protein
MRFVIIIGMGGFLGTISRYLSSQIIIKLLPGTFPFGTMSINICGCLLIGIFYALSEKGNILTPEWRMFLTTGFCGGFTTFSTFSYENVTLLQDGEHLFAFLYSFFSIFIGIAATFLGIFFIKSL